MAKTGRVVPVAGSSGAKRLLKNKRVPIQSIMLQTLYATGTIATAFVAPKALGIFSQLAGNAQSRKRLKVRSSQALIRLTRKGLARIVVRKGFQEIELTEKGQDVVLEILTKTYSIPVPLRWDGKWRVIAFDVREERKKLRPVLRQMLRGAGFVLLQDSVWIHPYPCDEFVLLLKSHLQGKPRELLHLTVEAFETDSFLRKHFNLIT